MIWEYRIANFSPVSINDAYFDRRILKNPNQRPFKGLCRFCNVPVKRMLTQKAQDIKEDLVKEFKLQDLLHRKGNLPDFDYYKIEYIFYMVQGEMFYKNGNLRKKDVSNFIKLIEDSFFTYLIKEIPEDTKKKKKDDSMVIEFTATKTLTKSNKSYLFMRVSESQVSKSENDICDIDFLDPV
jgi:hypothetical protein